MVGGVGMFGGGGGRREGGLRDWAHFHQNFGVVPGVRSHMHLESQILLLHSKTENHKTENLRDMWSHPDNKKKKIGTKHVVSGDLKSLKQTSVLRLLQN